MNMKKNNEEIILDNFLNSLYSIKDIYKLLYEIEKVLKLSVDYEVVKMICFGSVSYTHLTLPTTP